MDRVELLQRLIDAVDARLYLEIGVKRGGTFLRLRARRKIAVDPRPMLPRRAVLAAALRDPRNLSNRVVARTSDAFFADPPRRLLAGHLDVAFVDGLHTYEQSLRDVEHCVAWLAPGGVVVLHDCNPGDAVAAEAVAAPPADAREGWSGDVWKTIVHLRALRRDLETFVLDADCGLGVVTRGRSAAPPALTADEIARADYSDLAAARRQLLDLRPATEIDRLVASLARR